MTFTPEQIARETEWKSIFQACDKAKRILVKAMKANDKEGIAEYNRRVRAVNPRIRALTWTDWAGGRCPVASPKLVDCELEDGTILKSRGAGNLDWEHGDNEMITKIIRYRVISE